jgi:signal transduction histidine kinase
MKPLLAIISPQPRSAQMIARRVRAQELTDVVVAMRTPTLDQLLMIHQPDIVVLDLRAATIEQDLLLAQRLEREYGCVVIYLLMANDSIVLQKVQELPAPWYLIRPLRDTELMVILQAVERVIALNREIRCMHSSVSIGLVAGGVAHEFNNVLTSIAGNAELAMLDATPGSEIAICLQQISASVRRGNLLTRQLLMLAGRVRPNIPVIDLGPMLRDMEPFLAVAVGKRSTLRLETSPVPALYNGDIGRLRMLLVEVLVDIAAMSSDNDIVLANWPDEVQAEVVFEYTWIAEADRIGLVEQLYRVARDAVRALGGRVRLSNDALRYSLSMTLPAGDALG